MSRIRMEPIELLCVIVNDLDAEVERYSDLFGLEFRIFTPGIDYAVTAASGGSAEPGRPLPPSARIAMDTSGCFELVEMPGAPEGFRSIHLRVQDMEGAVAHLTERGLPVERDLRAGLVREVVFESAKLNGVRLCLVQYAGDSFAEALTASPRP